MLFTQYLFNAVLDADEAYQVRSEKNVLCNINIVIKKLQRILPPPCFLCRCITLPEANTTG